MTVLLDDMWHKLESNQFSFNERARMWKRMVLLLVECFITRQKNTISHGEHKCPVMYCEFEFRSIELFYHDMTLIMTFNGVSSRWNIIHPKMMHTDQGIIRHITRYLLTNTSLINHIFPDGFPEPISNNWVFWHCHHRDFARNAHDGNEQTAPLREFCFIQFGVTKKS